MKKARPYNRSQNQSSQVLRPNRLRMLAIYTLLFALAYGLGLLLRYIFNPAAFAPERMQDDWIMDTLIILGGPLLLSLVDYKRWIVEVQGGMRLEGFAGAFSDRTGFAVRDIDWQRTRRSLSSRLKIGNAIYSNDHQRILISPWFYNRRDYRNFLAAIGYEPADSTA